MESDELYHTLCDLGETHYQVPRALWAARTTAFSGARIPLSIEDVHHIQAFIQAVEDTVVLPSYQAAVLQDAPYSAQHLSKSQGIWFGYDFHLTAEGPKLIEINTNAGGACLVGLLTQALTAEQAWQALYVSAFQTEWHRQFPNRPLTRLAIVDAQPENQYFYPEFLIFKALLENQGVQTVIVDPTELSYRDGQLWHQDQSLEFVYNRLTDFYLTDPTNAALLQAYQANAVVLTPNPRTYALYANKQNLCILSDKERLRDWGLPESTIACLTHTIPKTQLLMPSQADAIWQQRKQFFFKPTSRYGGKGVYKGESISRRVFEQILQEAYIAQQWIPASQVAVNGQSFKMDVRAYVCEHRIVQLAARLYQGQTTNFRTVGGGFALLGSE